MEKKGRVYFYDFVLNKKIIEYNGDLWHANPKIFSENDTPNPYNPNLLSIDIWEKEEDKKRVAEINGYEIFYIWESEVLENRETEIQKCLDFLKENK